MQDTHNKEPSLIILLFLVSFASISAVLFTPALPEIASRLQITDAQAQMTMTVFLLGYTFGALPYGPLSNRYGRKPATYMGISLAACGAFLVACVSFTESFRLFLIGRFLMALGSSVGIKIAFTMVGDIYKAEKATQKISLLILAFAIGPGLATAIGGFLTGSLGWESCFYFLTAYSLLLLWLTSLLPETAKSLDPNALQVRSIFFGYLAMLKNKRLIFAALLMGSGSSILYLFAANAPVIGINKIGLSPEVYGLFNFIPPLGMFLGSALAHFLAGKKPILNIIGKGIVISFAGAIAMFLFFLMGWVNVWTLFFPMPLVYIGLSLVFSNASAFAMTSAHNKSNASAMMNFLNIGLSTFALLTTQGILLNQTYSMALAFVLISCLMAALLFLLHRVNQRYS